MLAFVPAGVAQQAMADGMVDALLMWLSSPALFKRRAFTFYQVEFVHYGAQDVMARSKRKSTNAVVGGSAQQNAALVWANITLDAEEVAVVEQLCSEPDGIGSDLVRLFATQGSFTLKYNPDRQNYSAFITAAMGDSDGSSLGISASANTGLAACAAVLLKLRIYKNDPARRGNAGGLLGVR